MQADLGCLEASSCSLGAITAGAKKKALYAFRQAAETVRLAENGSASYQPPAHNPSRTARAVTGVCRPPS